MKILIADDDPIVLRTLELRLKMEGYQVFTTADGRDALRQLEDLKVDIVITDLMMPFSSGLEIITKTKKIDPGIPVIVLSALDKEAAVQDAFALGANDYQTKPLNFDRLVSNIAHLLPK